MPLVSALTARAIAMYQGLRTLPEPALTLHHLDPRIWHAAADRTDQNCTRYVSRSGLNAHDNPQVLDTLSGYFTAAVHDTSYYIDEHFQSHELEKPYSADRVAHENGLFNLESVQQRYQVFHQALNGQFFLV